MGTTAEKLAYLADTKTDIKNAIVAKGVDVPEGTTFREYADLISGISTGLSDADLARANATPEDVTAGKTFYAGNRMIKTGTASAGNIVKKITVNAGNNITPVIPTRNYISIFWETTGIYGARLYENSEGTFNNLIYSAYSSETANTALKTFPMLSGDNVLVSITNLSNVYSFKVIVIS